MSIIPPSNCEVCGTNWHPLQMENYSLIAEVERLRILQTANWKSHAAIVEALGFRISDSLDGGAEIAFHVSELRAEVERLRSREREWFNERGEVEVLASAEEVRVTLDLEKLRALEKAATGGEWIARKQYVMAIGDEVPGGRGRCIANLPAGGGQCVGVRDREQAKRDGQFIAAARNALPDLLSALDEAAGLLRAPGMPVWAKWYAKRDALLQRLGRGGGE